MSKKFKFNNIITVYEPKELNESTEFEIIESYYSNVQYLESLNCIAISKEARETIFEHINWGVDCIRNSVEQGGLLIGHSYLNNSNNIIGFAKHAIQATTAKGSMAYLEFDHNTWKSMMDQLDLLNENEQDEELQIIGWYHTHPGNLSVFMSGTDLNTQRKMFSRDWQFAIVLNPQKQVWRAFNGSDAKECQGKMLK